MVGRSETKYVLALAVLLLLVALCAGQVLSEPGRALAGGGCAYRLDCWPSSGQGLAYLEEGKIGAWGWPSCPSGLRLRSLTVSC